MTVGVIKKNPRTNTGHCDNVFLAHTHVKAAVNVRVCVREHLLVARDTPN